MKKNFKQQRETISSYIARTHLYAKSFLPTVLILFAFLAFCGQFIAAKTLAGKEYKGNTHYAQETNRLWLGKNLFLRRGEGAFVRTNFLEKFVAPEAKSGTMRWGNAGGTYDPSGSIFKFNSVTQQFEWVPGSLSQISVGADGETWGVNAANEVYRYNPTSQLFEQAEGSLAQVAVGSGKYRNGVNRTIWGLNSIGELFLLNSITQNKFRKVEALQPPFAKLYVSSWGAEVWGLNAVGEIYRFNDYGTAFDLIPGQRFVQMAVADIDYVWGINAANEIYRYDPKLRQFKQVSGYLAQIAVGRRFQPTGGYAEDVWGINAAHEIYHFNLQTQRFEQVPGRLAKIAVGVDSVAGINDAMEIYRFNTTTQKFVQVPGSLSHIAVGTGGTIWGLN